MISVFEANNCQECFITSEVIDKGFSFQRAVEATFEEFNIICNENYLDKSHIVYTKIYLSDISNQEDYIKEYLKKNYIQMFFILVGQAPASGAKISIEAYFCKPLNGNEIKKSIGDNEVSVYNGNYLTTWGNLLPGFCGNSYEQTEDLISSLSSKINGKIKDNVLRTWFYIRDIDNNYKGMATSRKELFEKEGMTKDTHFIASTGIEGCSSISSVLVQLSYISILGLKSGQVGYMSAPQNMNPTYEYNVTFERGTMITYGDRTHYYISGTASIDKKGRVLHLNDVIMQLKRALENVEALLIGYNAGLYHLKLLVVYLRDYSDYQVVNSYLKERFRNSIPYNILKAPICRPTWLIEVEGIAINSNKNDMFSAFA